MAAFVKFQAFVEHLAEGVHNLGTGALTVALTNAANAPDPATDAVLVDLTVVDNANITDKVLNVTASSQTGGTYILVADDQVLLAGGGSVAPFRYVVLYNDTPSSPADPLIGYWDYGQDIGLAQNESLTIDFSASDGVLQIV